MSVEKISAKSTRRFGWKGNERTNKQTLRGSGATKVPSFQEWTSRNDDDDNGGEEKPPPSRRSFPTDKSWWVEQWSTAFCNLYLSARGRIRERKREQWGEKEGGNESKMLGGEEEMYIYIYRSLSRSIDERGRKRECRETRETWIIPSDVCPETAGNPRVSHDS